jgi:hypothetical protein
LERRNLDPLYESHRRAAVTFGSYEKPDAQAVSGAIDLVKRHRDFEACVKPEIDAQHRLERENSARQTIRRTSGDHSAEDQPDA